MAYAWSNHSVSYMVSLCGVNVTIPHKILYTSRFEDNHGNLPEKQLSDPTVVRVLYKFLPSIDEHNKLRQTVLALKKAWFTKNF